MNAAADVGPNVEDDFVYRVNTQEACGAMLQRRLTSSNDLTDPDVSCR